MKNKEGDQKRTKSKFEEDIKAPFISLYSFSTTVGMGDKRPLSQLRFDVLNKNFKNWVDPHSRTKTNIAQGD